MFQESELRSTEINIIKNVLDNGGIESEFHDYTDADVITHYLFHNHHINLLHSYVLSEHLLPVPKKISSLGDITQHLFI